MIIKIETGQEVEIHCFSNADAKLLKVKVMADSFGRLSFQNLN